MKPSVRNAMAMRIVIAALANRIAENSTTRKGPAKQPQQGVPTEPAVTAPVHSAQPAAPAPSAQPAQPAAPKKKKLAVFDFDDTLVSSHGSVGITHADGQHDVLDSHLFALYKSTDGETLDFTDFNDVNQPRKIKKGFDAIKAAAADPDTRVVILTARPKGSVSAVKKYMTEEGFPNIETVALQSSDPMSKADWISSEIVKNGHSEMSFMDDSPKNTKAVSTIKSKHAGVKINIVNPPLPTKEDYDGPESPKQHVSDAPTRAVSIVDKKGVQPVPGQHSSAPKPAPPPKPAQPATPAPGQQQTAQPAAQPAAQPTAPAQPAPAQPQAPAADKNKPSKRDLSWWREQSSDFQNKYLEKYPESRFKEASAMKKTVQAAIAYRVVLTSIADRIAADPAPAITAEKPPHAPAYGEQTHTFSVDWHDLDDMRSGLDKSDLAYKVWDGPAFQGRVNVDIPSSQVDKSTKVMEKKGVKKLDPIPKHRSPPANPHEKKKLAVFDFDDTLASCQGNINITHKDGKKDALNSEMYACYWGVDGETVDFSEFNNVTRPRKIKKGFDAIKAALADPNTRTVILTTRPKGAASAISKYMESQGIKGAETVALQSSDDMAKANWISDEVAKQGHTEVDCMDNSPGQYIALDKVKRQHAGVQWDISNVYSRNQPKDTDFDGAESLTTFASDNPTPSLSVFEDGKRRPVPVKQPAAPTPTPTQPAAPKEQLNPNDMEWWNKQPSGFKKRYLEKHPYSRFRGAASMPKENNQKLKDFIHANWKKTGNKKVEAYLRDDFWEKLNSMGDFAGHWMEQLESQFEKMVNPPHGLLEHFEDKDFDDLHFSLFGYKRRR